MGWLYIRCTFVFLLSLPALQNRPKQRIPWHLQGKTVLLQPYTPLRFLQKHQVCCICYRYDMYMDKHLPILVCIC